MPPTGTRAKKVAPAEISAKTPVSRLRQVIPLGDLNPARKRDPRFDSLSGQFNQGLFEKSYEFLSELENNEMGLIEQELKKLHQQSSNPASQERIEELERLKQRLLQSQQVKRQAQEQQKLKRQVKKEEIDQIKQGKRPFHLKKSQQRELLLTEKFGQIGDVDKVLEKRRKRTANRVHKRLPYKLRP